MTCACKVRKYGTLIFRPGTDLAPLPCEAMWKIRKTEPIIGETHEDTLDESSPSLETFNKLILQQIQRFLGQDSTLHYEYDDLENGKHKVHGSSIHSI